MRGLALLSRLGEGVLLGPARIRTWADALGVELLAAPEPLEASSLRAFLARTAAPDLLLVDVFPRGLLGELEDFRRRAGTSWLVTRRVRPAFYGHAPVREALASYARVLWSEEPPPELADVHPRASRIPEVLLAPRPFSRLQARKRLGIPGRGPVVFGLGAGPSQAQSRMHRLLGKIAARLGAHLVFATDEAAGQRVFPAAAYLAAADVAVAAGGYHAYHELRAAQVPAVFVPQWRRYDDQADRVRNGLIAADPEGLERLLASLLRGEDLPGARLPLLREPAAGAEALAALVRDTLRGAEPSRSEARSSARSAWRGAPGSSRRAAPRRAGRREPR